MKQKNSRRKKHNRENRAEARKLADFIGKWSAEEVNKEGCEGFFLVME
jgi:hypothetical protein